MNTNILRSVAVIGALAAIALQAAPAQATHMLERSRSFYPNVWPVPTVEEFAYDVGVPGGAFRDRIDAGAQAWNGVSPNFGFRSSRGSSVSGMTENCPSRTDSTTKSVVFYINIDGRGTKEKNIIGRAGACLNNDTGLLDAFRMRFDRGETAVDCQGKTISRWYTGASGKVGSYCAPDGKRYAKTDLQSAAAHEFGHATGFVGHYDSKKNPKSYCAFTNKDRQTMCFAQMDGQARDRTLGSIDKHIFRDIYGW